MALGTLCSPKDHLAAFEWFIDGLDGFIPVRAGIILIVLGYRVDI